MNKELFWWVVLSVLVLILLCYLAATVRIPQEQTQTTQDLPVVVEQIVLDVDDSDRTELNSVTIEPNESITIQESVWNYPFSEENIYFLACLVESEAGNQDEFGRRLVCDCVLNRIDSDNFPDDIISVIVQPDQFKVVSTGVIFSTIPTQSTIDLVYSELDNRSNFEVIYFRTKHYHAFGTALFKYQDHYFSK